MQDEGGDALIGRVLDSRWVIEEQIGEGGMGAVYLASQRSVDRKVAIKTLRPELCNSREFVDRFFREARVASTIAHPHCVTILDFGQTDDGILYLAMEYLEGMPLTHRLRHPDLGVREIVQICMQIASALAAAHDGNIIHRDLKPDNVFLLSISDGSTFIKVLDFGIAKDTSSDDQMTKTGQVFGTPEYMSPEQCRGNKIDGRSDLYSLGCILYRMLGGHPPFESDTPMAVLVSHVSEQPRHVRELIDRADVPEALIDLCMRLLEKDPNDRPDDAQAVRNELERIIDNTTTGGIPVISSPAQSDEHVSGPTLASDSAELVKDGGQQAPISAQQPQAQPTPQPQSAPQPQSQQPSGPQDQQRAEAPSGQTGPEPAAAPIQSQQRKSKLPLIAGIGFALVIAAGCTVGGLWYGYKTWIAEDGESTSIAGLLGDDEAGGDEESADESGEEASADDSEQANADEPKADEANQQETANAGTDGDASAAVAQGDDSEGDNGAKAGDDENQGGKRADDGAKSGDKSDDETATASKDDSDDDDNTTQSGGTTKIEINADKAEIAVSEKQDDKKDDGGSSSGSTKDNDKDKGSTTVAKTDDKPKEEKKPAGPQGNIREVKISKTGSACIGPNVDSVVRSAERAFVSCYNKELGGDPALSGKVVMDWTISTDGAVYSPRVALSQIGAKSCLLGKVKRLRFDPPIGGRCSVRATYRFYP
jgi:serine/threonine-protein kinase